MNKILLAILIAPIFCFGTAQFPEVLNRSGKAHELHSYPLGTYLWVYGIDFNFQEAFEEGNNSGCWRGYVGHWEIKNGKLYLQKVTSTLGEKTLPLSLIFLGENDSTVFASWFSGYLSYTEGDILYRSGSYEEAFERWVFLKVNSGEVVEEISRSGHAHALRVMLNEYGSPNIDLNFENLNFRDAFKLSLDKLSEALQEEGRWPNLEGWNVRIDTPKALEDKELSLMLHGVMFSQAVKMIKDTYGVELAITQVGDTVIVKVTMAKSSVDADSDPAPVVPPSAPPE